tara:strand:+ start:5619 stop:6536 length:918 start_codon:yes stop_codon:yes gene_type:complete
MKKHSQPYSGISAAAKTADINDFVGDSGSGGTKGAVPAPAAGDAAAGKYLKADGTWSAGHGSGDVVGPASAIDNTVPRYSTTTGKLIQGSGVSIDDSDNLTANNISGTNTGDQTNISGNAATVTTNADLTGDVTSVGNATTLTNAPVIAKVLTAYSKGAGTVAATDSILEAVQKLDANDDAKLNTSTIGVTVQAYLLALAEIGSQTIISETTTARTFALTDANDYIRGNNAATQTFTVPPNSSVAFPVGTQIDVLQLGAGQVVFAAGAGVTINKAEGLKISAQYKAATLKKVATDEWDLIGALAA